MMLKHVLSLYFVLFSSKVCLCFHVNPRPTLSIANNSLEAIGIANKINQFFESSEDNKNDKSGLQDLQVQPNLEDLGKSMIRLNLNLNLEIENGKPTRMTLPQGDLMLMYIPDRNEITDRQLNSFMTSTNGPTTRNKVSGGTLFTSWLSKKSSNEDHGSIMGRSDSLPSSISNDQDLKTEDVIEVVHEKIVQDPVIRQQWDLGAVPQFPNYHNYPGIFEQAKVKINKKKEQELQQKTDQLEQLLHDLKKKYRIDDAQEFSHQNMNQVVAGELTRPVGHMSSTVECSEINGETICKRKKAACSNSFGIGCQMSSLVPFSQPQGSMSMRTSTTTTRLPQFLQRRTTTTTTTTPASTTTLSLRDIEDQRIVDEVMQMDAHSIADAFTDPMMMALGGLITMAGAYMAIVMQEQAAASAFAVAAASGKKKKK